MAKKDAQSSRAPTRRQMALSRKEREQMRLLYMGLGLVVVLVLVVLGIGLLQTYVFEPNAPVAIVNGKEISTGAYQTRVRYERFILEDQIQQIRLQLESLPPEGEGDDQFTQLIRNQYQQLGSQLLQQRGVVDRQTLDVMTSEILIEEETQRRGITATEEEVKESIDRFLAAREGGLTAASASATSTARADASATATLWTPTPTFTPSPTLTTTTEITQPTATPANTSTPAPTPTLNVISDDALATQYTNWLNTLAEQSNVDEADYREYMRLAVLQKKLDEALKDEVPTSAEQAHARHILVETEEEANTVIKRLKAGEDFADLAAELSTDTGSAANGGDLGFVPRGRFVQPVEDAIFSLPIGEISDPIQSQFGWHVVEVLEREERELSPADYSRSQQAALSNWLVEARAKASIEDLWVPEKAPPDPLTQQQP